MDIETREKQIFASNLNNIMRKKGKRQTDLIADLGINRATISTWCLGHKMPRMGTIQKLADYFGVRKSDLVEEPDKENVDIFQFNNIHLVKTKKFPLLGTIAAGEPIWAEEDFEGYVCGASDINADFCLRISGDSMIGAGIDDGSVVYVRQQSVVNNGDIAAVIIEDEATLKRVYVDGDVVTLVSENPKYAPMVFKASEEQQIRILGRAVACLNMVK